MIFSSQDLDLALDIFDHMPQADIDRLRQLIAATEARVRAARAQTQATPSIRSGATGWAPVEVALFFILWTTSNASLARSW